MSRTMRFAAAAIAAAGAIAAAVGATALSAAPAGAATGTSTTVLLVHGLDGGNLLEGDLPLDSTVNCGDSTQTAWANGLRARGHTDVRTVAYYVGDYNCFTSVPGRGDNSMWTSLTELGRELAWLIHDGYTRHGRNVAISAHSMGGMVVRSALSGVQNRLPGFPPYVQVSDVVTSGSPHAGTGLGTLCSLTWGALPTQCSELAPGSAFLASLAHNPQGGVGTTDWTLVGTDCDGVVAADSALSMSQVSWSRPPINRVRFAAPGWPFFCLAADGYDHGELVKAPAPLDAISAGIRTSA